ncbi:MAG: hypothetical protein ACI89X_002228, partial [Planctomycetota bacterium]
MKQFVRISLVLMTALAASPCAAAQAKQVSGKPLTDEQLMAFALLDELDNTDTSQMPLIRVKWKQTRTHPLYYRYGFVVHEGEHVARIRHPDGSHSTIATNTAHPELQTARIEHVDFKNGLDAMIAQTGRGGTHSETMPLRLLFMARAAARRGHNESAHDIWSRLPVTLTNADLLREHAVWHGLLTSTERCLTLDFTDPEISHEEIKRRHERWLKIFPRVTARLDGGKRDRAGRLRAVAANSIREQVATRLKHIEQTMGPIATPESTAASADQKLVAQLRNARSGPVWPLIVIDRPTTEHAPGPAPSIQERIVSRGLSIVPRLITELDRNELTRCHTGKNNPMTFLKVHELAEQLLVRIAGYHVKGKPVQAQWQAWYASVQANGLRKVMQAELRQGNYEVIAPYLKRWPNQWPRVITLIENPENNITAMVALLRGLPKQLPRQALVASERVFASSILMFFKQLVAEQLALHTGPNGQNALSTVL